MESRDVREGGKGVKKEGREVIRDEGGVSGTVRDASGM